MRHNHKIPGLQSVGSRHCVVCGRPALAFCAGCGVTPYCGERCQRRDWAERHRAVCHNLARLSSERERNHRDETDHVETSPNALPAAPLRAPRPSAPSRQETKRDDDSGSSSDKRGSFKSPNYNRNSSTRGLNKRSGAMRRPNVPKADENENWGVKEANTPPPAQQQPPKLAVDKAPRRPNPPEPAKEPVPAKAVPANKPEPARPLPLASVGDLTPAKHLVPKQYLIETLAVGESAMLSVDARGADCRFAAAAFVCLAMNERFEAAFQALCDDFGDACAAIQHDDYKPSPGETCAYFDRSDGGWYRARCLGGSSLALLDASKLVALAPGDKCVKLPPQFAATPEFCCALKSAPTEVGESVTCKLLAKSAEGCTVELFSLDTAASLGRAELCRWLPTVDNPPRPGVPQVPRPSVASESRVLLVDATAADAVFVRDAADAAQRRYDDLLEQVALCGRKATPLKEPPAVGDTVLGMFSDGLHYRALCQRTKQTQNKYQLEYIEFGNVEILPLEKIYPCPPQFFLSAAPTLVSRVRLSESDAILTPAALEYIETLKQDELVLSVAGGASSAASGSLVSLTTAKDRRDVNRKLAELCTPHWKQLEQRGGDVLDTAPVMYSDAEFLPLPAGGCALDILDASMLAAGTLFGCQSGLRHARRVAEQLEPRIADYCNSEIGRQPYLPTAEEMCIAQCPLSSAWLRAVVVQQEEGAGGAAVRVCFVDRGHVASVAAARLRKMLPDFVVGLPVLASMLELADFPENPTPEMVQRGLQYLQMRGGRGLLKATRCEASDEADTYVIHAPGLIAAMTQK